VRFRSRIDHRSHEPIEFAGRIERSAKPAKVHTVDSTMTAVELAELIGVS